MPQKSSNFAAIRLPSRETLIQRLKTKADQILGDFDEVEEILLFGSLARGDEGTDSDADVLIILSNSPHKRYFDRIPRYAVLFAQFDIPVDVFPYTRAEIDRMQKKGNTFIQAMLDEGVSLGRRRE